jgi:hypothetical protein
MAVIGLRDEVEEGWMKFVGILEPPRTDDAPHETDIHLLNPQRQQAIIAGTGWRRLEPGSLNLRVNDDEMSGLKGFKALLCEDPAVVKYPSGWEHIPALRQGYRYYFAQATVKRETEEVLVRRAINPLRGRVELFAAVNLRSRFRLQEGDRVQVEVRGRPVEGKTAM